MTTVAVPTKSPKPLSVVLEYTADEVVHRFCRDHPEYNASWAGALELFNETKRWLWACAMRAHAEQKGEKVPANLWITPELTPIDEMWHCFLLFTREYQSFCQEYLGHFVHHDPLTRDEVAEFQHLRDRNPPEARNLRQQQLKPQLEYLHDLLGGDVVRKWYLERREWKLS